MNVISAQVWILHMMVKSSLKNLFIFLQAEEIAKENPIVCVAKGFKELVECKKSKRKTYRR